jgi:hypothetical protein
MRSSKTLNSVVSKLHEGERELGDHFGELTGEVGYFRRESIRESNKAGIRNEKVEALETDNASTSESSPIPTLITANSNPRAQRILHMESEGKKPIHRDHSERQTRRNIGRSERDCRLATATKNSTTGDVFADAALCKDKIRPDEDTYTAIYGFDWNRIIYLNESHQILLMISSAELSWRMRPLKSWK